VLDFDTEGQMHVHCVGYTEHLRQPTGQHTAHVDAYVKTRSSETWFSQRNPHMMTVSQVSASLTMPTRNISPNVYVPPHMRLGSTPP
jgi:hypothetical protein